MIFYGQKIKFTDDFMFSKVHCQLKKVIKLRTSIIFNDKFFEEKLQKYDLYALQHRILEKILIKGPCYQEIFVKLINTTSLFIHQPIGILVSSPKTPKV
ncbi:hypothetical protein BpHYR1_046326 [Brachionus plicatilis]|uniref:Uncharacterized protein n=1 Tax=Brachionus plicatilis TaxID=10195 RepID=A0A3M7QGP1_BRAPC|nr:hypothetical protein BpHYR1_046326 [Brachionus plicatilis]